jgi:endogenous inhibitor of DNA gyrase (YacG/DUF329 family)
MTPEEKEKIMRMREGGLSYTLIAQRLGLTRGAVSIYGLRHEAKAGEPKKAEGKCLYCGNELPRFKHKFCSRKCRLAWWKENAESSPKGAVYSYTCAFCGKRFSAYGNKKRKFCSYDCYLQGRWGAYGYKRKFPTGDKLCGS